MFYLFTHADLDGIACYIVAKMYIEYAGETLDVHVCDYDNINENLISFMDGSEWHEEDYVIISDISPDGRTARKIENFMSNENVDVVMLDHHPSAEKYNGYVWSKVYTEYSNGLKTSGASLVYDWFNRLNYFENNSKDDCYYEIYKKTMNVKAGALEEFVDLVRCHDTWEWKTNKEIGEKARQLNMLFSRKDNVEFIESVLRNYIIDRDHFPEYTPEDQQIIQNVIRYEKKCYDEAFRTLRVIPKDGYIVGVCFGGHATSIVCDMLLENYKSIDYIININTTYRKLEFRTLRDDIDLGKDIASQYGGGGHPKAAGALLDDNTLMKIYSSALLQN